MPLRKTSFVICLIFLVLCLAAGYATTGGWLGAALAVLLGPAWWIALRYPGSWLPFLCLLGSVGLAITGVLNGSPPAFLIFGSAMALALWDLVSLDSALRNLFAVEQTHRYEREHLRSLALTLGSALLAIMLGRILKVQVPFLVLLLSVAFVLFAIDRVWGFIRKSGKA